MTDVIPKSMGVPKSSLLRWEIGIALLIKIALLTGLWFLIFRWPDKPVIKPDIAAHFVQAYPQAQVNPDFSAQSQEDARHVR
jgi:hypothetical protein